MPSCARRLSEQLADYMATNPKAVLYGMGVADGATWALGLGEVPHARFPDRCWDAPACEATLTGMALGLSDMGWHPILVHCRTNFRWLAEDMMRNHVWRWKTMYGREPHITIICAWGDTAGQGAQHNDGGWCACGGELADALAGGVHIWEVPLSWLRKEAS